MVDYYTEARLEKFGITITSSGTPIVYVCAPLNQVLVEVSRKIDSYAAQFYAVPMTTIPEVIQSVCRDIAFYVFHIRSNELGTAPAGVAKLYEDAMAWLKDLEDGKVKLDIAVAASGNEQLVSQSLTMDAASMTDGKKDSDYNSLGNFALNDKETQD